MGLIPVIYMTGCTAPFNSVFKLTFVSSGQHEGLFILYIKRDCYCCPTDSPIDLIYPS